jgi:hypothetical protein
MPSDIYITDILLRPAHPLNNLNNLDNLENKKNFIALKKDRSNMLFWESFSLHSKRMMESGVSEKKFFGEYGTKTPFFQLFGRTSTLDRLKKHLRLLIKIAGKYQRNQNFSTTGEMKSEGDHIVRLLPYEFAFYTEKPLKQTQFISLIHFLTKLATGYNENLHLVFNFAVLQKNKPLFNNIVVYIVCGKNPVIKYFAKQFNSVIDPVNYGTDYTCEPGSFLTQRQHNRNFKIAAEAKENQIYIDSPYFTVTTMNGRRFGILLDICYDHYRSPALHSFFNVLIATGCIDQLEPIADQYNHVIISNGWLTPLISNLITTTVVNTDPYFGAAYSDVTVKVPKVHLPICSQYLPCEPSSKVRVSVDGKNRITIDNSEFGPKQMYLIVHQPYKLKQANSIVSTLIEEANTRLLRKSNLSSRAASSEYITNSYETHYYKIPAIIEFLLLNAALPLFNTTFLLVIASYFCELDIEAYFHLRKEIFALHLDKEKAKINSWSRAKTPFEALLSFRAELSVRPELAKVKDIFLNTFPEISPSELRLRRRL